MATLTLTTVRCRESSLPASLLTRLKHLAGLTPQAPRFERHVFTVHTVDAVGPQVSSIGFRQYQARMPSGRFATNGWIRQAETLTATDAAWFRSFRTV